MRILYIEDSKPLRKSIAKGFTREGFIIDLAEDGPAGINAAIEVEYDVIILDVMMPGMDGFEVLKELRKAEIDSKIIMLTARITIEDRVMGLEDGADDYLIKPFAWKELLARVRKLIQNRYGKKTAELNVGDLRVDTRAGRIWSKDTEIFLRPRELKMLEYLAHRVGEVVSRTELTEHVFDDALELKSNAVDSAICNIRKQLVLQGCENIISTIPRRGYLLESPTS